jgi:hypothetical protein
LVINRNACCDHGHHSLHLTIKTKFCGPQRIQNLEPAVSNEHPTDCNTNLNHIHPFLTTENCTFKIVHHFQYEYGLCFVRHLLLVLLKCP